MLIHIVFSSSQAKVFVVDKINLVNYDSLTFAEMKKNRLSLTGMLLLLMVCSCSTPETVQDYPFQPLPFTRVQLSDKFWAPRIETNRAVTIPFALNMSEETGRIENFMVAGALSDGKWTGGFGFNDSDVSKIIEGASYCLSVKPDRQLASYLDEIIRYYEAAQEEDGYLYTLWTAKETVDQYEDICCKPGQQDRWSEIQHAHQLYNAGHMYEAGAAHYQATGKTELLDVCIRNADLICSTFQPGGITEPPGHQEIELGLVKLYRATGDQKYLDQAKYFLDLRGRNLQERGSSGSYNQDHMPVVQQDEAVGHAVRANYMYAAMADVAALTGDTSYLKAIDRLWNNVVNKKLYLTGGVGASHQGEAYGANYELPNLTAYSETCASIANVYWNHRMFLLHGEAIYIDVMERSLYNAVLSGVALDGQHFFYPNPLASDGSHERSPWFGCACCPSNLTRFMASVGGYMYAVRDDAVYINLFAEGHADLEVKGTGIEITQETSYPWDGKVNIKVDPESTLPLSLRIRIPGWARNEAIPGDLYSFLNEQEEEASLIVNGQAYALELDQGYAVIKRRWKKGDIIELKLPMPVRRIIAHSAVEADRGMVALQRGPLVYCIEHPDVPDGRVDRVVIPDDEGFDTKFQEDMLGGIVLIEGESFDAIPYYAWAHRGKGQMAVWLPRKAML